MEREIYNYLVDYQLGTKESHIGMEFLSNNFQLTVEEMLDRLHTLWFANKIGYNLIDDELSFDIL